MTMTLPEEILGKVNLWLSDEFDSQTRSTIQNLMDEYNENGACVQLKFYNEMEEVKSIK